MEENFSMEWNMEEDFFVEWNMEWKIFSMEWKKITSMEYGKIVFHSIPCPEDTLNHFLVDSSAKTSLRSAKNVIVFIFCILVDKPTRGL